MKLYQDGDKSKAICQHCEKVVPTTFTRRNVPFSDGHGQAKNILVAVCDECSAIASIPSQSSPAIREARKPVSYPIEAMLPAVYVDLLDLAAFELSPEATSEIRKRLLTFYTHKYAAGELKTKDLKNVLADAEKAFPRMRGSVARRLSFKVSPPMAVEFESLIDKTGMSKTELIKSLAFRVKQDVLDVPRNEIAPELKSLVFGY